MDKLKDVSIYGNNYTLMNACYLSIYLSWKQAPEMIHVKFKFVWKVLGDLAASHACFARVTFTGLFFYIYTPEIEYINVTDYFQEDS